MMADERRDIFMKQVLGENTLAVSCENPRRSPLPTPMAPT